jgi:hypothetical protein
MRRGFHPPSASLPARPRSFAVLTDRNFKTPFSERRYIAVAPSLSGTAELRKSCGLVGVMDGRVGAALDSRAGELYK